MAKDTAPDTLEDLTFPSHGLNLIKEFESQPQGTTPVGTNVRAYETLTQRNRGGSRPGLAEYIPSSVLGFPSKIQHLNIIVDPTTNALLIDDVVGGIPDPSSNNLSLRNPGRIVRRGGGGNQPNRHKKTTPSASKIKFIQRKPFGPALFGHPDPTGTLALPISAGDLLLVLVWTSATDGGGAHATGTVTDTLGNNYVQIANYVTIIDNNNDEQGLSLWYAFANGPGPTTTVITSTFDNGTGSGSHGGWFLEYAGVTGTGAIDGTAGNTGTAPLGAYMWSTTPIFVGNSGDLILGAFFTDGTATAPTFPAGFVNRGDTTGSQILHIGEKVGTTTVGNQSVTDSGTISFPAGYFVAFGVSFKST